MNTFGILFYGWVPWFVLAWWLVGWVCTLVWARRVTTAPLGFIDVAVSAATGLILGPVMAWIVWQDVFRRNKNEKGRDPH